MSIFVSMWKTGPVVKRGPFFISFRFWPFLGHFNDFRVLGGIIYHPHRQNALNRRNAKNNLFWPKTEKIYKKVLVIKNKCLPLYPG